jgi:hypothetical protein
MFREAPAALCNVCAQEAAQMLAAALIAMPQGAIQRAVPAPLVCVDCGAPADVATKRFEMLCDVCAVHRNAARMAAPSSPAPGVRTSALMRARRAHLPATLSEEQWEATVAYFSDRCVYCGGPWFVIDFATPIPVGGGATYRNCLPACDGCVREKAGRTLYMLRHTRFDQDRLEAAIAWLGKDERTKG